MFACYRCYLEKRRIIDPCPEHPGWGVQMEKCTGCGVEVFYSLDPYGLPEDRVGWPGPDGSLYCPRCRDRVRAGAEAGPDDEEARRLRAEVERRLNWLRARFHCVRCRRVLPVVMDRDARKASAAVRTPEDLLRDRLFWDLEHIRVAGVEYRQQATRQAGGWTVKWGEYVYIPPINRDAVQEAYCLECAPRTGEPAAPGRFWVYREGRLDIIDYEPPEWVLADSLREEAAVRALVGDLPRIYRGEVAHTCPIRHVCGCE